MTTAQVGSLIQDKNYPTQSENESDSRNHFFGNPWSSYYYNVLLFELGFDR